MRSSSRGAHLGRVLLWWAIAWSACWTTAIAQEGEVERLALQRIGEKLATGQILEVDGYLVIAVEIESGGRISDSGRMAKAKTAALGTILSKYWKVNNWPAEVPPQLREDVLQVYSDRFASRVTIEGTQVVALEGGRPQRILVACPADALGDRTLDFQEVASGIHELAHASREVLPVLIDYELAQLIGMPVQVDNLWYAIETAFGERASASLRTECVTSLGHAYRSVEALGRLDAEQIGQVDALRLLELWPRHPTAMSFVARALHANGYRRMAQLVEQQNHAAFGNADACELLEYISGQLGAEAFQAGEPQDGLLCALWEYCGHLPVCDPIGSGGDDYARGMKLFYSGSAENMDDAYSAFILDLEDGVTTEALNMAGRTRVLLGDPWNSLPFFVEAVNRDPHHPYAAANLALSLHQLGANELAIQWAKRALENPAVSKWARDALAQSGLLNDHGYH